jgi:cobalt/nickel transport system permease protein
LAEELRSWEGGFGPYTQCGSMKDNSCGTADAGIDDADRRTGGVGRKAGVDDCTAEADNVGITAGVGNYGVVDDSNVVGDAGRKTAGVETDGVGRIFCIESCSSFLRIPVKIRLLATFAYIVALLSLPRLALAPLPLFALVLIAVSQFSGVGYRRVVRRSLVVLPFVLFVGIFNPIFEREEAFTLLGLPISRGWVSLFVMTVRALLASQSVILLLMTSGFGRVCTALRSLGVPALLVSQLQQLHRHLFTLLDEAVSISRAVAARGYGRTSYPPRLWATFIAQLLLRSLDRAERVHRAMQARGFGSSRPPSRSGEIMA